MMRCAGIVRRIDDLGRIVIPKEIRRTFNIREGDPLEIFTDKENGCVCFKKYDSNLEADINDLASVLYEENFEDLAKRIQEIRSDYMIIKQAREKGGE